MPKSNQTILLADEDDAARAFLATNLTADGYLVRAAKDRSKAIALLSVDQPDLIIADVNGQTLDLLDAVRSGDGLAGHVDPDTPMIVLSQRPDDIHRIRVLERGGDDIIAKPFSYPELRARVAAVLRRAECRRHQRQLRVASLTLSQRDRLCGDLLAFKPSLQKFRRNVKENALTKLLDGGQPLDVSGEIRAIDRKLNFIELAFSGGGWRLQTRKAVQACHFAQPMNPHHILQERVPGLLKLKRGERKRLGIEE